MGYQNVNEARLEELRNKHRPAVKAAVEERSKGLQDWRDCQGLSSKLCGFKHDPGSVVVGTTETDQKAYELTNSDASQTDTGSANVDELYMSLNGGVEIASAPDLQEQVIFFLCYVPIHIPLKSVFLTCTPPDHLLLILVYQLYLLVA